MIHDYWMHRSDDAFVRSFLPGIRTVLSWFTEKIDPHTGLLKNGLPHWNFTDWATSWERGIAPKATRPVRRSPRCNWPPRWTTQPT